MFKNDLIDKKIQAILDYEGELLDETYDKDILYYRKIRQFAEKHGGLLFFFDNEIYLIIHFIGEEDFLVIPVEYNL